MQPRGAERARRRALAPMLLIVMALCATSNDPTMGQAPRRCDIEGTAASERLVGSAAGEVICGRGGDDSIWGYGGDDEIHGGSGRDRIMGGVGEDLIVGGQGSDKLRGGPAEDRLIGGADRDILRGQHGPDFLESLDRTPAREVVHAGRGTDGCAVDSRDVTIGCETVVS